MTVYNGEQIITPRQANPDEQSNIEMYLKNKEKIKELIEINNNLLSYLPKAEPIVAAVLENDETILKTFIVDKPKGQYVVYKELDLVMNTKTTKKDLKEVGLD